MTKTPRFMDMTADDLRAAYQNTATALRHSDAVANAAAAAGGAKVFARNAGQSARLADKVRLIQNVARKRGIALHA